MKARLKLIFLVCAFCLLAHSTEAFSTEATQDTVERVVADTQLLERDLETPDASDSPKVRLPASAESSEPSEPGPRFRVEEIRFEGNTALSTDRLRRIVSQYEKKDLSMAELREAARRVTALYEATGFAGSRAWAPEQTGENGVATLKVLEARIGRVLTSERTRRPVSWFEKRLGLKSGDLLRRGKLERGVAELDRKNGLKVDADVVDGDAPGVYDVVVDAVETRESHTWYGFDNRGTQLTHHSRHSANFRQENFLGFGDPIGGRYVLGEQGAFEAGAIDYAFPIEATGTTLGFEAVGAKTSLVEHLKASEIEGQYWSVTPSATQPLFGGDQWRLDAKTALEVKDAKVTVDDLKTSLDRLRIARVGPRFTQWDDGGRTIAAFDFRRGIPDMWGGSSENDLDASRVNSGGDFTAYRGSFARLQALPFRTAVLLRASGQWTKDTLPAPEEFRIGGASSVRGYPEADAAGDSGFDASAELSVPLRFLPAWRVATTDRKWNEAVRVVAFIDGGKTFIRERVRDTSEKDRTLWGTGFGLRVDLNPRFSLTADVGYPIGDESSESDRTMYHVAVRAGF